MHSQDDDDMLKQMCTLLYCIVLYICLFQTRGPYKKNKLNYNYIK